MLMAVEITCYLSVNRQHCIGGMSSQIGGASAEATSAARTVVSLSGDEPVWRKRSLGRNGRCGMATLTGRGHLSSYRPRLRHSRSTRINGRSPYHLRTVKECQEPTSPLSYASLTDVVLTKKRQTFCASGSGHKRE
jgi:hypothetical protein